MTKDMYIELCYDGVNRPLFNPNTSLPPKESSDAPMQRNCP